MPSWLYKYTTVKRALQTLQSGEVYFAARRQLNDPFDCRFTPDLSTVEARKRFVQWQKQRLAEWENLGYNPRDIGIVDAAERESIHKRLVEEPDEAERWLSEIWEALDSANIGVYCLTENRGSLPMWAHYASNHRGCCLEFNFREHVLRQVQQGKLCFPFTTMGMVRYADEYPVGVMEPGRNIFDPEAPSWTKSTEWSYENEWRAIMFDSRVKTPISAKSISDLSHDEPIVRRMKGAEELYKLDEDIIHGVILGFAMTETDKAIIIAAARECGARVYQAKPKTFEFGLDITLVQDKPGNRA